MQGHPDKKFPGYEAGHADNYGERITDETRSIKETYFYLILLPADRAMFRHFHHVPEIERITIYEELTPAATGAFIGEEALK